MSVQDCHTPPRGTQTVNQALAAHPHRSLEDLPWPTLVTYHSMLETIKPWTQCGATLSSFGSATMHLKKVAPTSVAEPMTMMTRVQTQPSKIPRQTRTHCMLL
jgi:hypothetical protein